MSAQYLRNSWSTSLDHLQLHLSSQLLSSTKSFAIGLEKVTEICETQPSSETSPPVPTAFAGVVISSPTSSPRKHIEDEILDKQSDQEKLKSAIASALFWHNNRHNSQTSKYSTNSTPLASGFWFWVVIMYKFAVLALALVLILTFVMTGERSSVEASGGYRKPPFNGSIFGKRNEGGAGETGSFPTGSSGPVGGSRPYYGSFCEMAWETCFAQYLTEGSR